MCGGLIDRGVLDLILTHQRELLSLEFRFLSHLIFVVRAGLERFGLVHEHIKKIRSKLRIMFVGRIW